MPDPGISRKMPASRHIARRTSIGFGRSSMVDGFCKVGVRGWGSGYRIRGCSVGYEQKDGREVEHLDFERTWMYVRGGDGDSGEGLGRNGRYQPLRR